MTAQEWNNKYPIGTEVVYWPWTKEGEGVKSQTSSEAWLCSGTPVVKVEGKAGGIALTHVEVK